MKIFTADISDYGHRWGYPVVSIRLYFGLFIVFPFFLLLAVMAHIRFGWFTPLRQFYLLLGILAGIVGGYIEVYFVTRRLKREVEVVAWVLLPFGLVIWLLPMAYVYLFLDSPEFLPFWTYFFFPSIAIAMVTTGFLFRRFEKREQVRVFTSFTRYGFYPKYRIETPESLELELYGFLDAVAEKDTARLLDTFWLISYGRYAERLRELVEHLSETRDKVGQNISQIRELTTRLLDELIRFNRNQLSFRIFAGGGFLCIALMIYGSANNYFGIPRRIGALLFILPVLLLFIYTAIKRKTAKKAYEKAVQPMLEGINLKIQTIIREVLEQVE